MKYVKYLIIYPVLFVVFLVCMVAALAVGLVAGIFVAYYRAAVTYISSIRHGVDNKGARVFMTAVSGVAVVLPVLLLAAFAVVKLVGLFV